jgi:outer membrane protein, heavy metal efflux system
MSPAARVFLHGGLALILACQASCAVMAPPQSPSPRAAHLPIEDLSSVSAKSSLVVAPPAIQQVGFSTAATLQPPSDAVQIHEQPRAPTEELTVDGVIAEVLAKNPTLAQMVAAWQAVSARYPQVTALDDPNVDLTLAPGSIGSTNVEFGYRIGVSQRIPLGGKLALRGQAAAAQAAAAGEDVNDARLQLVESARTAFYEYFLVYRARAVNEESLGLLREARRSAESRVVTGKVNQQEILQIDVEIATQGERALNLERMRHVAVVRINTLMHRAPDSPLPGPPGKLAMPPSLPSAQTLRSRALESRSDLGALANRIAAEEAALGLAHREYYPDLMVGAAYDTIMGNGPTRDLAPQLSLGVNIPLQIGKRDAAVAEAHARVMERRAEFARLSDQVALQVEEACAKVSEAEKVLRHYEQTLLPAVELNAKTAGNLYATAQIPLQAYLEAERSLVNVRDRYYQVQGEFFQRRATLERVVGGSGF